MISDTSRHYLSHLFEPASVAVIGATESPGKIGEVLIANMLRAPFRGALYAVNPKYKAVQGVACYASVEALPEAVDLAVIATPAPTVPALIEQCGRKGIRAAVVITAGFSEAGPAGVALEKRLRQNAARLGVRMIGPNCLGILRPRIGLNAAFARADALPGSLGLVSQSGAVCAAMLDWALPQRIGFSSVVSTGGSTDVDFGEAIDYLANDPETGHILLYIEGVRNARRFLSAVRAAARVKPVILMKVGRHTVGSRAAVSHTGALIGRDDVFDAAIRRAGAVRVHSVGQLVAAADALAARVRPRGERLAIVTNGGGPGVMAADRAADLGLPLATLSPDTVSALQKALPANWSHGNPVDLIGDADASRYRAAVSACLADDAVDGVLAILTPQAMTDSAAAAQAVIDSFNGASKPLVACWMGEASVAEARTLLKAAGIPTFRTPDPAVEMFAHLSAFYRGQQHALQAPPPLAHREAPDVTTARAIVDRALAEGRTLLGGPESRQLLAAFHVPVARLLKASSPEAAAKAASELGFPVAMKIDSPDITHKTDAGGVMLNIADAAQAGDAYRAMMAEVARRQPQAKLSGVSIEPMVMRAHGRELMVGVMQDEVFGPAIAFGLGGTAVEVQRDRSVALPPLNAFLVDEMIRGTRVSRMLGPFRGMPPIDRPALEAVLLRVSEMVCELPHIAELDINPLIADESGVTAVDARVVLRKPPPGRARYAHMAIHPYPVHLERTLHLPDGTSVAVRPIRPEDAELEVAFVRRLSDASRRSRFMGLMRELSPTMLARFTQIDYDREMALVAIVRDSQGAECEIGVVRYVTNPDGTSAEFALVIADEWQRRGLGSRLLAMLKGIAAHRGIASLIGGVLADNGPMLRLCEGLGFRIEEVPGDRSVKRAVLAMT